MDIETMTLQTKAQTPGLLTSLDLVMAGTTIIMLTLQDTITENVGGNGILWVCLLDQSVQTRRIKCEMQ